MELPARRVPKGLLAQLVLLVQLVLLAQLGLRAPREQLAPLGLRGQKAKRE